MDIKAISKNTEPKTSISGLTYNNILKDIYDIIQDNSSYSENWTDFISSDGGRMIAELYAYVGEQLSNRVDQIGNELFIDTAIDKESLIRLLKLTGYRLSLPSSSSLKLDISSSTSISSQEVIMSSGISDGNISLNPSSTSFKSISSNGIPFELINYNENLGKYDYLTPVKITLPSSVGIKAYQGTTKYLNHKVTTTQGFKLQLTNSPVEKNSVSVFWTNKKIINSVNEFVEFTKVDNFFSRKAQASYVPVYKVNNLGNGVCQIEFPDNDDAASRTPLSINDNITIMYRTTNGSSGNLATGALEVIETGVFYNNRAIDITYKNTTPGFGGSDEYDETEIRGSVEDNIRNSRTLITEEDYEYIYKKENEEIGDIKILGEGNTDIDKISDLYGYYSNPLNIWILALANNADFNALYKNGESNLTDYINDIRFSVLEEDERINEIYQLKKASLNEKLELGEINVNTSEDLDGFMFNSYVSDIKSNLAKFTDNEDLKILTLNKQFVDEENFDIEDYRSYSIFNIDTGDFYLKRNGTEYSEISLEEETSIIYPINNDDDYSNVRTPFDLILEQNGERQVVTISPSSITTSEDVVSMFNLNLNDKINYAVLKDDITIYEGENVLEQIVNSNFVGSTTSKLVINNLSKEISVSPTITYTSLLTELNSNYPENYFALKAKTFAESGEANCYQLIVIDSSSFMIEDGIDGEEILENFFLSENNIMSITGTATLNFLDELVGMSSEDITEISSFDSLNLLSKEDGNFVLKFGDFDSIFIEINSSTEQLFGFSYENDYYFEYPKDDSIKEKVGSKNFFFTYKYKLIRVENDYIKIRLNSLTQTLDNCFVSILGEVNNKIKLGEYYENIENNDNVDISSNIKALLKRDAISCLYPTKFGTSGRTLNTTIDDYESNYEIKLTKMKVENVPFDKIGETFDIGAKIRFIVKESFSFDSDYNDERFFRIKINGKNFVLDTTAFPDSKITIAGSEFSILEENGYLTLDLTEFKEKNFATYFLTALRTILGEENVTIASDEISYYLETVRTDGFSSLDLLASDGYALSLITGYDYNYSTKIAVPLEGVIDVVTSKFNYFEIDDYSSSNGELTISVNGFTKTITLPFSLGEFALKINNDDELNQYIIYSDKRLILKSRASGDFISLTVPLNETYSIDVWKRTFPALVENEDGLTASAIITNSGDYYISRELVNGVNNYYFNVLNERNFPYGDLYFHMVEDNKSARLIDSNNSTNEYVWENSISDRKVMSVSHIYKHPKFKTFDLSVSLVYSNSLGLTTNIETSLKSSIKNLIMESYNIYNSKVGATIEKTDIRKLISANIPGIKEITIDYFGTNMETPSTSLELLECELNEKLIPASSKFKTEQYLDSNLEVKVRNIQVHGIEINISTKGF